MPTEVVMPQMGESITEGTLTKWLKKPGDPVERDEPLFEISTDKVDAEIPSPTAGVMGEISFRKARPSRSTPSSAPSRRPAAPALPPASGAAAPAQISRPTPPNPPAEAAPPLQRSRHRAASSPKPPRNRR